MAVVVKQAPRQQASTADDRAGWSGGTGRLSLRALQERLADSRARVFPNSTFSRNEKRFLAVIVTCFVLAWALNFLPGMLRLVALIPVTVEVVCMFLLSKGVASFTLGDAGDPLGWLDEYDALAGEDANTMQWIMAHDQNAIIDALDTLKERAIVEDTAFSMMFGLASRAGLITAAGAIYAQLDSLLDPRIPLTSMLPRIVVGSVVFGLYIGSWTTSLQIMRRQRLQLFLEIALERLRDDAGVGAYSLPRPHGS